jgi:hypothetical protein
MLDRIILCAMGVVVILIVVCTAVILDSFDSRLFDMEFKHKTVMLTPTQEWEANEEKAKPFREIWSKLRELEAENYYYIDIDECDDDYMVDCERIHIARLLRLILEKSGLKINHVQESYELIDK